MAITKVGASVLRDDIKLLPQQERVIRKIQEENTPGLIVYHGLGSGKTLSSIAAVSALGGKADVAVPASLRENYKKELVKYLVRGIKDFNTVSYDEAIRDSDKIGKGDILIADEAHRLRETATQRASMLRQIAPSYKKRLLLTGTPIVNKPSDLVSLINIAAGENLVGAEEFKDDYLENVRVPAPFLRSLFLNTKAGSVQRMKNTERFKKRFSHLFDYHENSSEDYPEITEIEEQVEMAPKQYSIYKGVMGKNPALAAKIRLRLPPSKAESRQLNAFANAVRQIANTPQGFSTKKLSPEEMPKLNRVVENIVRGLNEDPHYKSVVYSNYLESGLEPIAEMLEERGIPTAAFTGKLNDKKRKQIIEEYNKGELRTLLVSSAGTEGLDLKGTSEFHELEPHWNNAKLQQVRGRVARYKSHEALPKEYQKVLIHKYLAVPPKTQIQKLFRKDRYSGIDEYLRDRSLEKEQLSEMFLSAIRESS